jgi:CBS domain-containing protein
MDTELAEVTAFVGAIPPFDLLPDSVLNEIVREISISYLRTDESINLEDANHPQLYIVRKGALRYTNKSTHQNNVIDSSEDTNLDKSEVDEALIEKYAEGDICSVYCNPSQALLNEQAPKQDAVLIVEEDSLIYNLDYNTLKKILSQSVQAIEFIEGSCEQRLHSQKSKLSEDDIISSSLSNTSVSDFYHHPVVTISPIATIQEAAITMTEQGFSCLVVIDPKDSEDKNTPTKIGIITDKDIRRRCVAQGLPISSPVSEIMTSDIATLDINSSAYEALILMTSKHIHHLPITQYGKLAGMVTVTDLMNNEGHNAINMASIIHKATTLDELVTTSKLLKKLQIKLTKLGANADHIGKSISAITMAFTIRLIEMAEQNLGKAPVSFAWLAAGSQARQEQLAHSDQDNALIICDSMQPKDDEYFKRLAAFVSDGLAACGFIYCPGDIMATNDEWRQTQTMWQHYFDEWIDKPSPAALLNSSVFFDLTTIYGDYRLLEKVRTRMLEKTARSTLFIAHMSSNALRSRPPLGFFRDFVLIQNGKNKSTLDLKHNGIAPIVDLARIYALSEGVSAVNTIERLKLCAGTKSLTKSAAMNLIDAYEFLTSVRLEHQAKSLIAGQDVNSYIAPSQISRLEREHLKDAFKVIKSMQDYRQSAIL